MVACWTPLISLLLVYCLPPPGAKGQKFLMQVEPQDLVVPAGGSLLVNCSSNCPSTELINLETFLRKEPAGKGLGWAAFRLSNVTVDSKILCSGFCKGLQITGSSNITVYRFPERVELAPMSPWNPVGKNLTLRCWVVGGAPRTHLSVLLLRGEEVLSRQQAVGEFAEVTATVLVSRNDHGANFSCRTELDLRPQGPGLFQNSSAPRQLRTFVLPVTPPCLIVPRVLEVGTSWPVNCTVDGLFPASEAQVQLALGDHMLNPEVTSQGDTLEATATVTANKELEGTWKIVCNVTLGGESQETQKKLTVYSFWGPVVNLSKPTVLEGTTVNVTCTAGARVQVTLDGAPAVAPGQLALLQLNASRRDNKRSFVCNATLEVDGVVLHRSRSVQLRVLCNRFQVPVGIPFFVKLNYSGAYYCRAAKSQGTYTLTVVMNVQDQKPLTDTIIVAVFAILGLVVVIGALVWVFGGQKRSDIYHVKQGNTWLPLTSKQPEEVLSS